MAARVLLVDVDVETRRLVELTLVADWVDVAWAEDVTGAAALARESPPAVVLAGSDLEGREGERLIARLREEPALADVPVVRIARRTPGRAFAAHAPGDAELTRPIDPRALREVVRERMRAARPEAAARRGSEEEPMGGDDLFGDGDFDLAGALDDAAPEKAQTEKSESEGFEQTVVMSRDDLGALRDGLVGARKPAQAPPERPVPDPPQVRHTVLMSQDEMKRQAQAEARQRAQAARGEVRSGDVRSGEARSADAPRSRPVAARPADPPPPPAKADDDELETFQTMIMSRDELRSLRSRAEEEHERGRRSSPPAAATMTYSREALKGRGSRDIFDLGTDDLVAEPPEDAAPGSREAVEAMVREAARATEQELVGMLSSLDPKMSDAVRSIAGELAERVARRVLPPLAERQVDEEIARIRRALQAS